MRKKLLLLLLASIFLSAGVASASSIWGTYKGKQVIRLTVDGVPVKVSDAPAVSMDGRTMVPVYLLQQAGISYRWDQKNQTVDIIKSVEATNDDKLSYIKDLSKLAAYYNRLEALGSMISGVSDRLSFIYDSYSNGSVGTSLDDANSNINEVINYFNTMVSDSNNFSSSLSFNNLNIDDGKKILDDYYDSIDYFKDAYSHLNKFVNGGSSSEFSSYIDSVKQGSNKCYDGRSLAINDLNMYFDYIQKY